MLKPPSRVPRSCMPVTGSHRNACSATLPAMLLNPVTWPLALMPLASLPGPTEGARVLNAGRRVPQQRKRGPALGGAAGSRHLPAGVDAVANAGVQRPAESAEILHAGRRVPPKRMAGNIGAAQSRHLA